MYNILFLITFSIIGCGIKSKPLPPIAESEIAPSEKKPEAKVEKNTTQSTKPVVASSTTTTKSKK